MTPIPTPTPTPTPTWGTSPRPVTRLLAPLVALVLVLAGCSFGDDTMTLYAEFDDAQDLVTQAQVRAGDVPVGLVTAIDLTDDLRARVTMEVDADLQLPGDTAAWLSKTSLLGERFVDLRPQGTDGRVTDGMELADTRVVTDLEDLVGVGSDTLAFVAADRLAAAVQLGAEAFGGRGALIDQLVTDLRLVVGRYEDGTDTITGLIDELAALTASLAPDAEANAGTLDLLLESSDALAEQDERLLQSLADLQRLAVVGERILEDNAGELDDSVRRLRVLLAAVDEIDGALAEAIEQLPNHNLNVGDGVTDEFAQVWTDFVVCGLQSDEDDVSNACEPANGGSEAPPPQRDPCPADEVRCPSEVRE